MVTYKLFRLKGGKLYPLFVECSRQMPTGVWLDAGIGELADETHVRSRLGPLALRAFTARRFRSRTGSGSGRATALCSGKIPSGASAMSKGESKL